MVGLSAALLRRQQFLVRCLGDRSISSNNRFHSSVKMQSVASPSFEVDAVTILKSITPSLDPSKYKGQAGILSLSLSLTHLLFIFVVIPCFVGNLG